MTRLVIVESPTKAKTIRGFLPKGYQVEACMGHVRDLPADADEIPESVKGQSWARLGVNVGADFEPLYVIPSKKKKVIAELRAALKEADELIVATDEDREGESIGWHLLQVLKPKVPVRRMVFHEITKDAIQAAIADYRSIDDKLVRAQETRRILDRLVGYTLSPLLWKKISPGLSAGRVQSVAVRLLVQREEARRAFRSGTYWDIRALLSPALHDQNARFEATLTALNGQRIATGKDFDETTGQIAKGKKVVLLNEQEANTLIKDLQQAAWTVREVIEKPQRRQPPPPFTTSTLQQEANRKLRLSSRETMSIAQSLYEEGYITYMRTDSVHLSSEAIGAARHSIIARYGEAFLSAKPRQYTTSSKGAQEAHEAIRPAGTQMRTADEIGLTGRAAALYEMIWKRTMATQMADAQITIITVNIDAISGAQAANPANKCAFQANGKRIDFPGYFRVYVEGSDDPDAALDDIAIVLPPLQANDPLTPRKLEPIGHETQPPARFTEASLIQMLESEGVGRPSTYATIIGTIQDRGYAIKAGNQLTPTFTAFAVTRLLTEHFPDLVDTKFTARMEQKLDDIADGDAEWLIYLKAFFLGEKGLENQVLEKEKAIDPREVYALALAGLDARVKIGRYGPYLEQITGEDVRRTSLPETMAPADLSDQQALKLLDEKDKGHDALGIEPASGLPVYVLTGRFGPYVQLGETTDGGEKPKRASLLKGMKPESLSLETALKLLSLPRRLGTDPLTGEPIDANVGRYGPFVQRGKDFRSLTAGDDVLSVTLTRALELLAQPKGARNAARGPRAAAAPLRDIGLHPQDGLPIVILDGRYGPYVKHGDTNATLPKGAVIEKVTLEQAVSLIAEKAAKGSPAKPKGTRAKTATARTGAKTASKTSGKNGSKPAAAAKRPATKKPKAPQADDAAKTKPARSTTKKPRASKSANNVP
jgi:DNA topoisomerase-1